MAEHCEQCGKPRLFDGPCPWCQGPGACVTAPMQLQGRPAGPVRLEPAPHTLGGQSQADVLWRELCETRAALREYVCATDELEAAADCVPHDPARLARAQERHGRAGVAARMVLGAPPAGDDDDDRRAVEAWTRQTWPHDGDHAGGGPVG